MWAHNCKVGESEFDKSCYEYDIDQMTTKLFKIINWPNVHENFERHQQYDTVTTKKNKLGTLDWRKYEYAYSVLHVRHEQKSSIVVDDWTKTMLIHAITKKQSKLNSEQ